MALSVSQLTVPITKAQALDTALAVLRSIGFEVPENIESWQPGSLQRTQVEMLAEMLADASEGRTTLAKAGFNPEAFGIGLTLKSKSDFDHEPNEAGKTVGTKRLTAAADAPGPFTFAIGDLVVADEDDDTLTYRNSTGGTLIAAGTLDLEWEAETGGSSRNVPTANGVVLVTQVTGVTCANVDAGLGDGWIITPGSDAETYEELRERNRLRWYTLTYAAGDGAYAYWARTAHDAVKRVAVDAQNPRGPGTIDVYIAGDSGALPTLVSTVQDYILGVTDGVGRAPIEAQAGLEVYSATERSITIAGTVYISSIHAGTTAKEEEIEAQLIAFEKALPIGGTKLAPESPGKLLISAVHRTVNAVSGVLNFAPTTTTDTTLDPEDVVVFVLDLDYEYVG